MAKKFSASLRDFQNRTVERMKTVLHESVQEVITRAQTPQPDKEGRGGGPPEPGKIPVDTGFLLNSLASGLNGNFGPPSGTSYIAVIEGMELGDVAQFAWTAEYALPVELGHGTYPGAHFVGMAVADWANIVNTIAART